ncbi:MAG: hypothetical protein A4E55_01464 [Pelotomaculum sp. PtaU1.Bin035]|nr:MAG: hypothetical protein A4E55_01464 [Pelotomaculum sp. PtaU1.Bin035]
MYHKETSSADMKMFTITSILLTIPFVFYMKDIANSLHAIAEKR